MMFNKKVLVLNSSERKKYLRHTLPAELVFLMCLWSPAGVVAQEEEEVLPTLEITLPAAPTPVPVPVVVIDPGHGGKNTGMSVPEHVVEKEYVLELARELKKALQSKARVAVFLTRKRDIPVSVLERTTLANRKAADVFVSLHLSDDSRMYLYINHHVDEKNVAQLYADEIEKNAYIVPWDLAQNEQRKKSKQLGKIISKTWNEYTSSVKTKGQEARVELVTAPIAVLTGIRAAALLLEVPLPKKKADETMETAGEAAKQEVARNLARGILRYLAGR